MWIRRSIWILLTVSLAVVCAVFGNWIVLALLASVLLLPVLSLPGNLVVRKRCRVSILPPGNLQKKQEGALCISLENNAWFPAALLRCRVQIENQLTGARTVRMMETACLPRQHTQMVYALQSDYSGNLCVTVDRVQVLDCLGVLALPVKAYATLAVTVQPDTFVQKIVISTADGCPDDSEVYDPYRPGYDQTETFQLREYRPGDSPKQIHWKLTEKVDRLMVRDPSLPISRSVVVFWERTGAQTLLQADLMAEVVASACRALVEQSVHFTVVWNDTASDLCVMQEIRGMEELAGLLPRLLSARSREGGVSGVEAFLRTVGEGVYSHILYVAAEPAQEAGLLEQFGRLTVLSLRGGGVHIDLQNYAEQLLELEI